MTSDLMKHYYAEDRARFARIERLLEEIEHQLKRINQKLGKEEPAVRGDFDEVGR
jgi:hypothetical protein